MSSHFPYEMDAKNQMPMPDGLPFYDKIMYQELRFLYRQLTDRAISREDAKNERRKMVQDWEYLKFQSELLDQMTGTIKATELARAAYRKNRTLENADALVTAIDGVPVASGQRGDDMV